MMAEAQQKKLSPPARRLALVSRKAFTLAETLLSLLLGTLLLGALLMALLFLQRSLMPRRISVSGGVLPVAPSYAAFSSALQLQERLIAHLDGALATYVLGGEHTGLEMQPACVVTQPLLADILPRIAGFTNGLPQDSASFLRLYSAELGPLKADATPADFSVLIIGLRDGVLAVTCLLQCRASEVRPAGELRAWRRLEVRLQDFEGRTLSYAFLERPGTEADIYAAAVHTWYRLSEQQGIFEEGPACVVLPDPWRFGGDATLASEGGPFSRFTYFLPVGA